MIGWIFLLSRWRSVICGIRVAPEYLNYYKVVTALKETATQLKADDALSPATIHKSIESRFDTGYVDEPNVNDIVLTKADKGWSMTADYEKVVPMFANVNLLLVFKTTVVIN